MHAIGLFDIKNPERLKEIMRQLSVALYEKTGVPLYGYRLLLPVHFFFEENQKEAVKEILTWQVINFPMKETLLKSLDIEPVMKRHGGQVPSMQEDAKFYLMGFKKDKKEGGVEWL